MAFNIHFDQLNQNLLSAERQATSSIDSTSLSYPSGAGAVNSKIENLSAITTTLSNYASYMSDAKNSFLLLSDAYSGLSQIQDKLNELRTIAVLGQGVSMAADSREEFSAAFNESKQNILQITNDTIYNGTRLLDGSVSDQNYVVGPNVTDVLNVSIESHTPNALNLNDVSIDSAYKARQAVIAIDDALAIVNASLNQLGATQTQLDKSLSENKIKFIKLSDTKFRSGNLTSMETQNYSTELQSDRYQYVNISNLQDTTNTLNIIANKNLGTSTNINPQELVVYLYQNNDTTSGHSFSLKL